jgi:hypothetical protein
MDLPRASSSLAEEPSDFTGDEMLDVPPSPAAKTATAKRGEPLLRGRSRSMNPTWRNGVKAEQREDPRRLEVALNVSGTSEKP